MNHKALIQYKGTDFSGFSRQLKGRTVEGELQKALLALFKQNSSVAVAGRTDSGVHALGQVISFRTDFKMTLKKKKFHLNAILPEDVKIVSLKTVDDKFDARRSASARQYAYYILNRNYQSVFNDDYVHHYPIKLDLSLIKKGAKLLLGANDLKAFSATIKEGKSYIRDVKSIKVENRSPFFDIEDKDMIKITIKANAFLYRMVRIIAGTLIEVGRAHIEADALGYILKSRDRNKAGPTAPAKGLFLEKVFY